MARLDSGSFRGNAEGLTFEFRVGRKEDGSLHVVSGDALRDGAFMASFFCKEPLEDSASGIVTGTILFRGHPELVTGHLRLEADERGLGSFSLGVDLEGNYRDIFAGRLERSGDFMRRLTIEIDGLQGTQPPATEGYHGRSGAVTIARAFEGAGFDTIIRVDAFQGRAPSPQRARGYSLAEIHSAMESVKGGPTTDGLHVHVYVCSYMAGRDGRNVLGVMYDFAESDLNRKPREGVAIFYDHPMLSDPRTPEDERRKEYVYTAVHEIGHALNLLHSFDKARPSALSWMNYPHLYPRGYEATDEHDGTSDFWRRFPERFDDEEILHLHHATPREIAAGGFAFGTYEEGASLLFGGPASPRLTRPGGNPLRAIGGVELSVEPIKREYAVGEPVFMRIGVANASDRPVRLPDALDPTDGYLRLTFRSPSGRIIPYRPPVRFCRQSQLLFLPPGARHRGFDGAPVFLSATGPLFTEPGEYQVSAELTGINGSRVAYSRPSSLRITVPDRQTEQFAERLWSEPAALRALYLRHPLVAPDAWSRIADGPLPKGNGNTTAAYFDYVAGLGWASTFAPTHKHREYEARPDKAALRFAQVDPDGLPSSVEQRIKAFSSSGNNPVPRPSPRRGGRAHGNRSPLPARLNTQSINVARTIAARPAERQRVEISPSGLFGAIGLDRSGPSQLETLSPFVRILPQLRGSTRFADIVTWNIEHLHNPQNWQRMPQLAKLIRDFRCDFWGLQEVDEESLKELVTVVNSAGRTRYAYVAEAGRGQQCGAIYRPDTTRVARINPSPKVAKAFEAKLKVALANGKTAERAVFYRKPLLLDVRVAQSGLNVFDFRCAVVHLKSTDSELKDTGSSLRSAAATALTQWIADDRDSGIETDYLILGDLNAETAEQGLAAFSDKNDLRLLSVGMEDTYGPEALTRVASGRLLDHIVITSDSVPYMPVDDLKEQIIIRADTKLADWTTEYSDHVPVAVRFVLGEDQDARG